MNGHYLAKELTGDHRHDQIFPEKEKSGDTTTHSKTLHWIYYWGYYFLLQIKFTRVTVSGMIARLKRQELLRSSTILCTFVNITWSYSPWLILLFSGRIYHECKTLFVDLNKICCCCCCCLNSPSLSTSYLLLLTVSIQNKVISFENTKLIIHFKH